MLRKIYKGFRNSLSPKNQSLLSQIVFQFSGKPFVKKDTVEPISKFPQGQKFAKQIIANIMSQSSCSISAVSSGDFFVRGP